MSPTPHGPVIRWTARLLQRPGNLEAWRRFVGRQPDGVMLESLAPAGPRSRYSIYAWEAVDRLDVPADLASDPFDLLAARCRPWASLDPPCPFPLVGGWIGHFAYEAGRCTEPSGLARRDGAMPTWLASWRLYDSVVLHDRVADCWYALACENPQPPSPAPAIDPPPREKQAETTEKGVWNLFSDEYLKAVERALEYIRAGDVYQVNLARRWRGPIAEPPWALYERLGRINPAGYAAYLALPSAEGPSAIVSSSPELFLELREGRIVTRPIKGTRRRSADPSLDRAARDALAASEKDRAELNMIIDLERNDLGRVSEFGSVHVLSDGEIEAHPTVWHRTATIEGRLREGLDAFDLLRATFPGGSVTGAPKVRAMQIIGESEPDARGPYCGAIGYIGLDGNMTLNLPIRTLLVEAGRVDLHVGSGIVADSDPADELHELDAKAAALLAAIGEGELALAREAACP